MLRFFKRSLIVLLVAMMLAPFSILLTNGFEDSAEKTKSGGKSLVPALNYFPAHPDKKNNLASDPAYQVVNDLEPLSNIPKRSRSTDTRTDFSLLCIRVQFQTDYVSTTTGNGTMLPEHDMAYFDSILGRMETYYDEVSYGLLTVNTHITEQIYTLDNNMSYYGANDERTKRNVNLVNDAVIKADPDINFNQYRKFIVIHAGSGEESDVRDDSPNDIWSNHVGEYQMWAVLGQAISTDDGTTIRDISIVPETQDQDGYFGSNITGVICHEFGHDLGLPDLYDVDYNSNGIGIWGLMGAGGHLNNGVTPGHPCAWSKVFLGWVDPVEISANTETVYIRNIEDYPDIYKIIIPDTDGKQYFLIENRARTGFDYYLPHGGLLIWHIDESVMYENLGGGFTRLDANDINTDPSHKAVDLEEASGTQELDILVNYNNGDSYDPWYSDSIGFTPSSTPNSADYSDRKTEIHFTAISRNANTMTFSVMVEERRLFLTGPQKNSSVALPGEPASFDVTLLTNRETGGATMDWVTLVPGGPDSQWVSFKENPVKIPQKNKEFVTQVYVTVPPDALYLDKFGITISAISNDSTPASETVFLNVTANKITGFSMDLLDDINILPGPGNTTILSLWLNNTGNNEEIYYLSASRTDDEWATIMSVEYMFSLSLDYVDYLIEGRADKKLRDAFELKEIEMDRDAQLLAENGEWILKDRPDEYRIVVNDSALDIYNMNRIGIDSYSRGRVSLHLFAPWESFAGDRCTVTIKMTHNDDEVSVSFNVTVVHVYGISIIPDNTESIGRPHEPIVYNFELINKGNGPDNVSLILSEKKSGWNITYEPRYLVLEAGASGFARVTIYTHDLAPPRDEFIFSMIATSSSGKKVETVPLIVTVEEYDEMAVHLPVVNATLKAGAKSASLVIQLENRGSSDDRYAVVTFQKPEGFTTALTNYPASNIPIDAYGVKFLVLQLSMTGKKEAGTYSFIIGVQSKNNGSLLRKYTLNVTVEEMISIDPTIDSDEMSVRVGRKVTFYVDIENIGNTLVTAHLVQESVPSNLKISIIPEEAVTLRMDKMETIAVEVTALNGISPGVKTLSFVITLKEGSKEHLLDINVRVMADSTEKEPLEETSTSSSNLKIVLGIIGLVLVLALAAGMFFFVRRKKRSDPVLEEEKSPDDGLLTGSTEGELGDTVEVYSDFTVEPEGGNTTPMENRIVIHGPPQEEMQSPKPSVPPPPVIRKTLPMPDKSPLVLCGESTALRCIENASSPSGASSLRVMGNEIHRTLIESPILCREPAGSPSPKKVRIVKRIDADK